MSLDIDVANNSGVTWSGFALEAFDNEPAGPAGAHPPFAHFHDSEFSGFSNPVVGPGNSVAGYNSTEPTDPQNATPSNINGDNHLGIHLAQPFQSGTSQTYNLIGVHSNALATAGTGNSNGFLTDGSFVMDLVPIFNQITSAGGSTNQINQTITGQSDALAVGSTISLFDNGGTTAIGTGIVQSDNTWSVTATLASQGANSIVAENTDTFGDVGVSSAVTFNLDTTTPTVGFTPGITFDRSGAATISGIDADPSSPVTGVEVFDGTTALGAATLNVGGTWTLANVKLPSGSQSLSAQSTDALGNVSALTPDPDALQTGIRGQPYTRYEEDFDSAGNLTGELFTKSNGQTYLADNVTNLPSGGHDIYYSSGTFFNTQDYFNKNDLFSANYTLRIETLYNNDGTHSITGFVGGQVLHSGFDDTMTGGGRLETFVFNPHFGQDEITDFRATGAGHDTISLSSTEFSSIAQVLAHTHNVDGGAVIDVGHYQTITLDNVSTAELKANQHDFKLHA